MRRGKPRIPDARRRVSPTPPKPPYSGPSPLHISATQDLRPSTRLSRARHNRATAHTQGRELIMHQRTQSRVAATLLAIGLTFGAASPALAGDGYRGSTVYGCRAYIQEDKAWTNCKPATRSVKIATKAWCTGQPTTYGAWTWASKGKYAYNLSSTECLFNVHYAQTLAQ